MSSQCLSWVKLRRLSAQLGSPLCPSTASSARPVRSQKCHNQTHAAQQKHVANRSARWRGSSVRASIPTKFLRRSQPPHCRIDRAKTSAYTRSQNCKHVTDREQNDRRLLRIDTAWSGFSVATQV